MKRLKHTPGPWFARKWSDGRKADGFATAITDSRGHGIVTFCQYGENAKVRANAQLIAAAPTMFGKLADTVAWLDREIKTVAWADMKESALLIERLTELRDDLAETLRKITEGS